MSDRAKIAERIVRKAIDHLTAEQGGEVRNTPETRERLAELIVGQYAPYTITVTDTSTPAVRETQRQAFDVEFS